MLPVRLVGFVFSVLAAASFAQDREQERRGRVSDIAQGTLVRIDRSRVEGGGPTLHEVALLEARGGRLIRVDLGPVGVLAGHSMKAGDQLRLHLRPLTLGAPEIFVVRRAELNGRPIHLNRVHSGPPWSPSQPHAPARLEEFAQNSGKRASADVQAGPPRKQRDDANHEGTRWGGTFDGTLAQRIPQGFPDAVSGKSRWQRPYYQQPGHPYFDAPMGMDRPLVLKRAWDESTDAYRDAFFFSGSPDDAFEREERFGPGYERYSRGGTYGRFLPLDYGYRPYTEGTFGLQ